MISPTKNSTFQSKKIHTRRHAASLQGLNRSLVQLAGEL